MNRGGVYTHTHTHTIHKHTKTHTHTNIVSYTLHLFFFSRAQAAHKPVSDYVGKYAITGVCDDVI